VNAPLRPPPWFEALPASAPQHFALQFFAALLVLLQPLLAAAGSARALRERLPFLDGYLDELEGTVQAHALADALPPWRAALAAWEAAAPPTLPLRRLMDRLGLGSADVTLLLLCGLAEEDPRLAALWALLQGEGHEALEPALAASLDLATPDSPRVALARLQSLGLLQTAEASGRGWQVPGALWPLLRGDGWSAASSAAAPWVWHDSGHAPALDTLVLTAELHDAAAAMAERWRLHGPTPLALRGRAGSGRRSLLRALAREAGWAVIEPRPAGRPMPEALWSAAALLGGAIELLPGPPEPLADAAPGPMACRLPPGAAVPAGWAVLDVPMPDPVLRRRLWQQVLQGQATPPNEDDLTEAARHRLPAGTLVGVARAAAASSGRPWRERIQQALATRHGADLGRLARRESLPAGLGAGVLALPPATRAEWQALLARCRHREALAAAAGPALAGLGPGVRALFKGPSGTGKTLAARVLAAELGLALYRVDLGAVVDKYIGETEKHLEQVFSAAETLDAMLLLDEGDALLAPRTGVASATDRYANLETNYLLQRLEAFEGILVVTSNAAERIDAAFLRRLDAVLDFPLPGAAERLALWRLHLSAGHRVPPERLQRVAQRCALAGGQIRNVALHAALLGLQRGGPPGEAELDAALAREYRRAGQALPPGAVESSTVAGD
jgi:hypothetical protein